MRRKRDDATDAAITATTSGAGYGAIAGGLGRLLAGGRTLPTLAKSALAGAGVSAGLSGGSTLLGTAIMGEPLEGDPGAYTHRGTLGGAVGGGLAGMGLGALLGSGRLGKLAKSEGFLGKLIQKAGDEVPMDNLVADQIKAWMKSPNATTKTAAAMGLLGAGGGAYWGGTEGMQTDFVNSQLQDEQRRRYLR